MAQLSKMETTIAGLDRIESKIASLEKIETQAVEFGNIETKMDGMNQQIKEIHHKTRDSQSKFLEFAEGQTVKN